MTKKTIYVSFDVEADGPNIITNSCIMLGIAVSKPLDEITGYEYDSEWLLAKENICIKKEKGTIEDPATMDGFWKQNQEVYKYIKDNEVDKAHVSGWLYGTLESLQQKYDVKYVARPTSYDIPWVKSILDGGFGESILSHTGLCISTMLKCCDYLGIPRDEVNAVVRNPNLPHTHMADDDAVQQLYMFIHLKKLLENYKK